MTATRLRRRHGRAAEPGRRHGDGRVVPVDAELCAGIDELLDMARRGREDFEHQANYGDYTAEDRLVLEVGGLGRPYPATRDPALADDTPAA